MWTCPVCSKFLVWWQAPMSMWYCEDCGWQDTGHVLPAHYSGVVNQEPSTPEEPEPEPVGHVRIGLFIRVLSHDVAQNLRAKTISARDYYREHATRTLVSDLRRLAYLD